MSPSSKPAKSMPSAISLCKRWANASSTLHRIFCDSALHLSELLWIFIFALSRRLQLNDIKLTCVHVLEPFPKHLLKFVARYVLCMKFWALKTATPRQLILWLSLAIGQGLPAAYLRGSFDAGGEFLQRNSWIRTWPFRNGGTYGKLHMDSRHLATYVSSTVEFLPSTLLVVPVPSFGHAAIL